MTTLAGDPDLEHLLQLLSMLPGPAEDIPFWASIRARVVGPDPEWPDRVDYAFQKMQGVWNVIQDPSPTRVMGLAEYMLVFFSGDDPELWKLLNRVTNRFFSLKYDDAGRWWAKDVCETAWRLYVRAWHPADSAVKSLTAKWRYENGWFEWMPQPDAEPGR